jgi:hypothetical protein
MTALSPVPDVVRLSERTVLCFFLAAHMEYKGLLPAQLIVDQTHDTISNINPTQRTSNKTFCLTITMAFVVPNMLRSNQTVSDAQLEAGVHYAFRTTQYYINQPKSPFVNPTKQYRLIEEGYLVLNAAERRGLQRNLDLNTLGRLRTLLERLEQQMLSRGAVGASPAMRTQTHNLYH